MRHDVHFTLDILSPAAFYRLVGSTDGREGRPRPRQKGPLPMPATKIELPEDIAAMTCGAKGCKKPPVHAFDWSNEPEPAVKAHREAYHAGTYRGSVSGFRSLLSMTERGEEVAYGKRPAKPKAEGDAKPKSAGTSAKATADPKKAARNRRLAKANGGELRPQTPPVREMHSGPVARTPRGKAAMESAAATA